ncbi:MAG: hypothetical protein HY816_16335 [Candidatus Wallbacteria bacterium]|nr:hypothetical protein [Candidatus Wallbacteria bacterium]
MLYVVLTCVVVAVIVSAALKYRRSASRLPTLQAILYFLRLGAEFDMREPVRARGILDAVRRARSPEERTKAEEILRVVVAQGPPAQVQPALAVAWALGFADFESLLATAISRECLTRAAWDDGLELLQAHLKA